MRHLWQTVDTASLLQRKTEQTTSANVGAYPVPLGQPLRASFPASSAAPEDAVDRLAAADPEYARALRSMGWIR